LKTISLEGKLLPFNRTVAVREVALSVPDAEFTPVTWPVASNQGLVIAANSANFVAPRDGVYGFTAVIRFDPLITIGLRSLLLYVGSTPVVISDFGSVAYASISAVLFIEKDQIVQLRVFQNSGSALNLTGRLEVNQLR
jgi:hypothetical protein